MFGPLPRMYRILVIAGALLLSVAGSAWLAHQLTVPLPFRGLLVGTALGSLIAYLLIHDFSAGRQARPLRVSRRR